jgi:hypothetical protein
MSLKAFSFNNSPYRLLYLQLLTCLAVSTRELSGIVDLAAPMEGRVVRPCLLEDGLSKLASLQLQTAPVSHRCKRKEADRRLSRSQDTNQAC